MTDIILVKTDPIMNQSSIRSEQIVRSLRKKYSVLALGWNRGEGRPHKSANEKNFLQIFRLSAPYGCTFRYLAILPIFWAWVFIKLCINRPTTMHAFDLDTVPPCFVYKMLFGNKLVFDMHDRYAMAFIPWNKGIFYRTLHTIVDMLEEKLANNADVLLSVYDKMFSTLKKRPEKCVTIMACPEYRTISPSKGDALSFRILFTGHVRAGRGLDILLNIFEGLKDAELLITGRVEDKELLKRINQASNCKYIGFLNHTQLLDLELSSDAIIALYDSNFQTQHEYGMANKILEAMMCALPVITNIASEIINQTGCGLLVKYDNINQIKQAIITLRDDPDLCTRLGNNGHQAYLEKYNWNNTEIKLFETYDTLLRRTG